MSYYIITEHRGRKITDKAAVGAEDPETALRICPIKQLPPRARKRWQFIDDGLGGGALIDPRDQDHCFRADPREFVAEPEAQDYHDHP